MRERFTIDKEPLQLLAILVMTLDHVAYYFLPPGSLAYQLLTAVGCFTGAVMSYFLVEGFAHTRSVRRYALRLLGFGLLAEPGYYALILYAFRPAAPAEYVLGSLNVLFTLLICLGMLALRHSRLGEGYKTLGTALCLILSLLCDWALFMPILVRFLDGHRGDRRRQFMDYVFAGFLLTLTYVPSIPGGGELSGDQMIRTGLMMLLSYAAFLAAGYCCIYAYSGAQRALPATDKARQSEDAGNAPGSRSALAFLRKRAIYIYYPLHLTVLAVIRLILGWK